MLRRMLALLLTLVLVVGMVPTAAFAAEIENAQEAEAAYVDLSALGTAIDSSQALLEGAYTPESLETLMSALEAAETVFCKENVTQEEADSALALLLDAVEAMEEAAVEPSEEESPEEPSEDAPAGEAADTTGLMITVAEVMALNEADYTPESWATLMAALEIACLLPEDADQETVDAAWETLTDALATLKETENEENVDLADAVETLEEITDLGSNIISGWDDLCNYWDEAQNRFILTEDVVLAQSWEPIAFEYILDGNGHTVTLTGAPLFYSIAKNGVVKNLRLTGEVTAEYAGPVAYELWGTIRNCVNDVKITVTGEWATPGGFVHSMEDGLIYNCLYTGPSCDYGIAANWMAGDVVNCYYNAGEAFFDWDYHGENCRKVTMDEIATAEFLAELNANCQEGDLAWALVDGQPVPGGEEAPVAPADKTALNAKIAEAEALSEEDYTADTWAELLVVLLEAETVADDENATQAEIDAALAALTAAMEGLEETEVIDPNAPIDLSDKDVIEINTVYDLSKMQDGKYYKLMADLTLPADWDCEMNCVLDGNGHTITLSGEGYGLFYEIGKNGVVQNLGVKGNTWSMGKVGTIASACYGKIINCYSLAEVSSSAGDAGGLVGWLRSGGVINNCYSAGKASSTSDSAPDVGGLAGYAYGGSLVQNSYWLNLSGSDAVGDTDGEVKNCAAVSRKDFYEDTSIRDSLNDNRGEFGLEWGISSEYGYPMFCEDGTYVPPEQVTHIVTFTPDGGGDPIEFNSADGLNLTTLISGGSFSCEENGGVVFYDVPDYSNEGTDAIYVGTNGSSNYVLVENPGTAVVVAYAEFNEVTNKFSNELFRFTVTVEKADELTEVRLVWGDKTLSEGDTLTVAGSTSVDFKVQVKQAEGQWQDAAPGQFEFSDNEQNLYVDNRGTCYATAPGKYAMKAVGMGQTISVYFESTYVAVESIKPMYEGTYVVHERDPLSGVNFVNLLDTPGTHTKDNVQVTPWNASYVRNWTMTSSNPKVAKYADGLANAVMPYQAGSTTLTVTCNDPQTPNVSGSSEITIEFLNPLTAISLNGKVELAEGEEMKLPITLTGPKSAEGYHVTEAKIDWKYDSPNGGKVNIYRQSDIIQIRTEKEYAVSNDEYYITGITEGTVTVTGTPVDASGDAEPIEFTVTVVSGDPEVPADNDKLVNDGIPAAQNYLIKQNVEPRFGNEWVLFSLDRSGVNVEQADVEAYVASVKETYQDPGASELKPTTLGRVILTLTQLGVDAANVDGLDLIELLCSSDAITGGSNEAAWALIALDSAKYAVPQGAKWNRDSIIDAMLAFQCENGGFGLFDNKGASVDMTGMCVQALAPYNITKDKVSKAVYDALVYLQGVMDRNCDFGSVEATSQVLVALTALGYDPLDEEAEVSFVGSAARNLITALTSYQNSETGAFQYSGSDNLMATYQGLYGLEAYRRFRDKENRLYDLTDVELSAPVNTTALAEAIAAAETLNSEDYTAESFAEVTKALDEANKVLADPNATQQQVDDAATALNDAVSALTIKVTFRLVGDEQHSKAAAHKSYVTWIPTMEIELPKDSKVYDAFKFALDANGMGFKETQTGYIGKIQAPAVLGGLWLSEFDNGTSSGWMYTVNGVHTDVGLRDCTVKNGDAILWHYVDDYASDDGSWKDVPDTAPVAPEKPVNTTLREAYEKTYDHLRSMTPATGSVGGEWLVLGLARSEFNDLSEAYIGDYYAKVEQLEFAEGDRLDERKSTENSRLILALTAIGRDPTSVAAHDLTAGLNDMDYIKKQGVNGPIWALIALATHDYKPAMPISYSGLINEILSMQDEKGAFGNTDITAMALTALAPYCEEDPVVQAAVDKTLEYLSRLQSSTGGFPYGNQGESVESCVQVIVALSALGIDADTDKRFVKDGNSVIDAFLSYYDGNGAFYHNQDHSGDGQMATEQAFYAMAAYFRNQKGEESLFDMRNVALESGGSDKPERADKTALKNSIAKAEKLNKADYTATSWNYLEAKLNEAKKVNADSAADQSKVDTAQKNLENAIKVLRPDKTALNNAISKAESLKESDYTAKSWGEIKNALAEALADAKKVRDKTLATLDEVNQATEALEDLFDKLVKDTGSGNGGTTGSGSNGGGTGSTNKTTSTSNKTTTSASTNTARSKLEAQVKKAEELKKEDYTAESWKTFETALKAAQDTLNNSKATQTQLTSAYAKLVAAEKTLKKLGETLEESRKKLEAQVKEYEKLAQADYTPETWKPFADALTNAKKVLASESPTAKGLDDAYNALVNAATSLEKAVDYRSKLESLVEKCGDLVEEDYTPESWACYKEALNKAQEALKDENTDQQTLGRLLDNLNEAGRALVPAADRGGISLLWWILLLALLILLGGGGILTLLKRNKK